MKRSKAATVVLVLAALASGCARLEAARQELAKAEEVVEPTTYAFAVSFDASTSFRAYLEKSLDEAKQVFQRLAVEHPDANVTVLMINTTTTNLFSGPASKLQTAYDALADKIRRGGSEWSNLSDTFARADFFLKRSEADIRTHIVFSDMEHAVPGWSFNDAELVPVPPKFPWSTLRGLRTYLAFVSYEQWQVWSKAARKAGVSGELHALLPEDLKARHVADVVLPHTTTENN